jgi:hypothetical protein
MKRTQQQRGSSRIGVALAVIAILAFQSGCALRVLHRTNEDLAIGETTLYVDRGPTTVSLATTRTLAIDLAEFGFINGKGHEFEDSVTFEALKNVFTAEYYATWWVERWLVPLNWFDGMDKEEMQKEASAMGAKKTKEAFKKYLAPTYALRIRIEPLTLHDLNESGGGTTFTVTVGDESLEKWIGFVAAEGLTAGDVENLISTGAGNRIGGTFATVTYQAMNDLTSTGVRSVVPSYGWRTAWRTAGRWSWHLSCELLKTPVFLVVPYKWGKLADLDRFLPSLAENDRVRFANVVCAYPQANATQANGADWQIANLKPDQAKRFRVRVDLLRDSKVNDLLDEAKERIDRYSPVADALGAKYGDAGRRVGGVLDRRVKSALKKRVQDDYYAGDVVFSGQTVIEGPDFPTRLWFLHNPMVGSGTDVGETVDALADVRGDDDIAAKAKNGVVVVLSLRVQ